MDKNRGLNFLVGIVTLFLLWRAYTSGLFDNLAFMATANEGEYQSSGLGAVFFAFALEVVATLGAVVVLLLTGLWELLLIGGRWTASGLQEGLVYLKQANGAIVDRKNSAPSPSPAPAVPEPSPSEPVPAPEAAPPDPLLYLAKAIRDNENRVINWSNEIRQIQQTLRNLTERLSGSSASPKDDPNAQ